MNQDRELWKIYVKQTSFQVPKTKNLQKLFQSLAIAEYIIKIEGLSNEEESFYLKIRDKIKKINDNPIGLILSIFLIYVIVLLIIISKNPTHSIL